MRISDWSSDVCSSDLLLERQPSRLPEGALVQGGQVVDRRQARSDTPFAKCICCGRCGSQIAENRVAPASGNEACRAMSDCGPGHRQIDDVLERGHPGRNGIWRKCEAEARIFEAQFLDRKRTRLNSNN